MSETSERKKSPFVGDVGGLGELTKERLISELFTENNLARKTEIDRPYEYSALELVAFHLSDMKGKLEMVPEHILRTKDFVQAGVKKQVVNSGGMLRAFINFHKNNMISHARGSRLEYITALQGVQDTEGDNLKKQRQLESVIGI